MVLDKSDFLLDEQIRQVIVSLEPEWSAKRLTFDLELPKTKYHGSQTLMSQVWQNIISNAIKFSNPENKISITINSDENICVRITDYGIGMDSETQKHIFEKFYQGDLSRSSTGNGLGLSIVSEILRLHNAKIRVESEQNKGSTFTIMLSPQNSHQP